MIWLIPARLTLHLLLIIELELNTMKRDRHSTGLLRDVKNITYRIWDVYIDVVIKRGKKKTRKPPPDNEQKRTGTVLRHTVIFLMGMKKLFRFQTNHTKVLK